MTGYTVHTGSTEKFSQGWDEIFKEKTAKRPAKKQPAKNKTVKTAKAAKKSGKKKK